MVYRLSVYGTYLLGKEYIYTDFGTNGAKNRIN